MAEAKAVAANAAAMHGYPAREYALIQAAKKVLLVKGLWTLLPETARSLREALTPYADCPPCCMSPELCAGTGRCPRDPVCNN